MDDPVDSLTELEANLQDLARANRFLGGVAPIERIVERIRAETILDVGCGAADIPRALLRRASHRKRMLAITCLDKSDQILRIAGRDDPATERLTFVRGDATSLPFPAAAFDVATCSLTLHHLPPDAAVVMLRELRRVSRAPVVCDLRRSPLAYAAVWTYVNLFSRNRLTRHDGPISVLRAYTPNEALALARKAGWHSPRVRREPWFRMTLVDDGV